MTISEFTLILRSKGWTVESACERWDIRMATYYARCRNESLHSQLRDMCHGLPNSERISR